MNSAVLCARCPALRNIITDFWIETQDTGGGLELSLESHEPVLACICRYIHTGLLLFSTGATQAIDPPGQSSCMYLSIHCTALLSCDEPPQSDEHQTVCLLVVNDWWRLLANHYLISVLLRTLISSYHYECMY